MDDVSWLPEQISTWTCILATEWMIVHLSLRQFSHIKLRMTYTYGESGVLYIYGKNQWNIRPWRRHHGILWSYNVPKSSSIFSHLWFNFPSAPTSVHLSRQKLPVLSSFQKELIHIISRCPVAQEIQQDFTWAASSICWKQHRTIARQNSPSITIDCHGSWSTRVDWFFMIFSPCVRVEFCNVRLTYGRGFRRSLTGPLDSKEMLWRQTFKSIRKDWLKENDSKVWF